MNDLSTRNETLEGALRAKEAREAHRVGFWRGATALLALGGLLLVLLQPASARGPRHSRSAEERLAALEARVKTLEQQTARQGASLDKLESDKIMTEWKQKHEPKSSVRLLH